jgi:hypothetical protein
MNLAGNRPYLVAQPRRRVVDSLHDFWGQRRSSQSLPSPARNSQAGQRPFLDQRPLELGDGHHHAELKLTNGFCLEVSMPWLVQIKATFRICSSPGMIAR